MENGAVKTIELDTLSDESLTKLGVECDGRGHYSFIAREPQFSAPPEQNLKVVKFHALERHCLPCGSVKRVMSRNFQPHSCTSIEGLECGHTVLITRVLKFGKFLWWNVAFKETIKVGEKA